MDLKLRHINKSFKGRTILKDISFEVGPRELVSIVGPSGVGKTSLLNIIARLDRPDDGEVIFSSPLSKAHPVIMVFQDYVLFPGMTVAENIGFGLRARHLEKSEILERVEQMLNFFHLDGHQSHYPAQLSAGQKQRVAIARAMVVNPAVLLLDEPFANLDRNLKMETARFIRHIQKAFGIPTISVTHDLEEAFAMSDRIGVLLQGRLQQFGTPKQVYFKSGSREVAKFLGPVNIIPEDLFSLFQVPAAEKNSREILARPEGLDIQPGEEGPGQITDKTFAGHYTAYTVKVNQRSFIVYSQTADLQPGRKVALSLKPFHSRETRCSKN